MNFEQRRKERQKNIKVNFTTLHSKDNNAFHTNLSLIEAWELLAKISKESYFLQTGQKAPNFVDKNRVIIKKR